MRANKPEKPYPEFPLTAHPAGVWVKKIKGKVHRFGGWSDPEAALAKYLAEKDYLTAGKEPPKTTDGLTLIDLVNLFLDAKYAQVQVKSISIRTWAAHKESCIRILKYVDRATIVEDMKPADFDKLGVSLAKGVSLVTFGNRIRLASVMFRFASETDLIPKPLKFGGIFKAPSKSGLRAERQAKPRKDFKAEEIQAITQASSPIMRAMVLLGINCAFGQMDCSSLLRRHVDLDRGWIDFPRPKTAIERRCPLWPETVSALRIAYRARPNPYDESFDDQVFLTITRRPYIRISDKGIVCDAIGGNFLTLLEKLGLNGNQRSFYGLRRTFETIASAARDQIPVDHIMGHSPASDDMAAIYRQHIDDDRLKAVSDHVRNWLWPKVEQK